ncbi:uncharacterized protein [Drosophila pseudoobscura]|uniref:Uncharacterized protein n=1 Tax=Drosophila pseudoobscura pseudoobscura TaxID=46245 RepID=A0A6I8V4A0_DROPS|nr:uncharacterized protein LOC6898509 [Drosophila pseudoobscura]
MKQFALFGILLLILALGLSEWPQQVSAVALAQPQKGPKAPPSGGSGNQQSGQGQNGQNGQNGQGGQNNK